MADLYDCSDPDARAAGLDAAADAIARGELVLLPTDTVYGVAADAFTPAAVTGLLAAKNRGRAMPVPVLIGEAVDPRRPGARACRRSRAGLAEAFWPGGLTLVVEHAPSLAWDLGDAEGTVAVRLPGRRRWPATCCAAPARSRCPAPTAPAARPRRRRRRRPSSSATHAAVVLDGGPRTSSAASTIVDCTAPTPRVLRVGAIPRRPAARGRPRSSPTERSRRDSLGRPPRRPSPGIAGARTDRSGVRLR